MISNRRVLSGRYFERRAYLARCCELVLRLPRPSLGNTVHPKSAFASIGHHRIDVLHTVFHIAILRLDGADRKIAMCVLVVDFQFFPNLIRGEIGFFYCGLDDMNYRSDNNHDEKKPYQFEFEHGVHSSGLYDRASTSLAVHAGKSGAFAGLRLGVAPCTILCAFPHIARPYFRIPLNVAGAVKVVQRPWQDSEGQTVGPKPKQGGQLDTHSIPFPIAGRAPLHRRGPVSLSRVQLAGRRPSRSARLCSLDEQNTYYFGTRTVKRILRPLSDNQHNRAVAAPVEGNRA